MSHAITGSATVDGRPIYRRRDGGWSRRLHQAEILQSEAARDAALAVARSEEGIVCDPYAIEVAADGVWVRAVTLKERIRAAGPTVAYGA